MNDFFVLIHHEGDMHRLPLHTSVPEGAQIVGLCMPFQEKVKLVTFTQAADVYAYHEGIRPDIWEGVGVGNLVLEQAWRLLLTHSKTPPSPRFRRLDRTMNSHYVRDLASDWREAENKGGFISPNFESIPVGYFTREFRSDFAYIRGKMNMDPSVKTFIADQIPTLSYELRRYISFPLEYFQTIIPRFRQEIADRIYRVEPFDMALPGDLVIFYPPENLSQVLLGRVKKWDRLKLVINLLDDPQTEYVIQPGHLQSVKIICFN